MSAPFLFFKTVHNRGMFTLQAEGRTIFGKELKSERLAGRLPIVVYGRKDKAQSLFVPMADFKKVFKLAGESSIITLTTPTGKKAVSLSRTVLDSGVAEIS